MQNSDAISEIIDSARDSRMTDPFDLSAGEYDGFVIAGASGYIVEHTLKGFARAGIRPLALVDNNRTLQGTIVDGIPVLSPSDGVGAFPNAVFVSAIFTHTPLRRQLRELGAARVIPYAALFHKFPEIFLPYFAVDDPSVISAEAQAVVDATSIWADEESQQLYRGILRWFVTLDSESVPPALPASAAYFPELLKRRNDEVFVDCGAFDGDTLTHYARTAGGQYKEIIALEPDPNTFQKLRTCALPMKRVTTLNAAAGALKGRMAFLASGLPCSHAASAGATGLLVAGALVDVDVVRIDDLKPTPTYVKMDIEGFEKQALAGSHELLGGEKTAFAITLYHRMSDLWQIPLYVHQVAPNLKLFLRHYAEDWSETICYAIPADRLENDTSMASPMAL